MQIKGEKVHENKWKNPGEISEPTRKIYILLLVVQFLFLFFFPGFLNWLCCFSQEHSAKVMKLFADIFGWLPLATVVNNKILVTHGGISNITDLSVIDKIDRHKVSALNHFFLLILFLNVIAQIIFRRSRYF